MSSPELQIYSSTDQLFRAAAQEFVTIAKQLIRAKGSLTVALSGGSTPKGMNLLLATEYASALAWNKIFFFFGDERHVPPDNAESNYRMAFETLLSKVPVDPAKIFRVHSENPDANVSAIEYEQTLSTAFRLETPEIPRFDLILLGLGPDGHTASLFPRTAALHARSRLVVANHVEKLKTDRITFTLPVLNNAANVVFLVAGQDKAPALKAVLDQNSNAEDYPAKLVQPRHGRLLWMLTEDAAAGLAKATGAANLKSSQR